MAEAPPNKKAKTEGGIVAEGASVPSVIFKCRVRIPESADENPFDWKDVTTEGTVQAGPSGETSEAV